MPEQLELGAALRDEGIARVWGNTPEEWRAAALEAIADLAAVGARFTSEHVRELVGDPPGHYNAMGAAFNTAARRGLIRKVGYVRATRPSLHATDLAEWMGVSA